MSQNQPTISFLDSRLKELRAKRAQVDQQIAAYELVRRDVLAATQEATPPQTNGQYVPHDVVEEIHEEQEGQYPPSLSVPQRLLKWYGDHNKIAPASEAAEDLLRDDPDLNHTELPRIAARLFRERRLAREQYEGHAAYYYGLTEWAEGEWENARFKREYVPEEITSQGGMFDAR